MRERRYQEFCSHYPSQQARGLTTAGKAGVHTSSIIRFDRILYGAPYGERIYKTGGLQMANRHPRRPAGISGFAGDCCKKEAAVSFSMTAFRKNLASAAAIDYNI
jgi:hypothetical protein